MSLVEVELVEEIFHVAAVLLGGTAQAGVSFDESGYAVHFQELVLVLGGDVLHHVGDQFGADAVLDALENAEGVGYGRLADLDDVALVHHFGRFDLNVVNCDAALLAGFGCNGAGLENTHGPEPLVNTSLSHNLYLLLNLHMVSSIPARQKFLTASTATGIRSSSTLRSSSLKGSSTNLI